MIESVRGRRWQHAAALLACKACNVQTHTVSSHSRDAGYFDREHACERWCTWGWWWETRKWTHELRQLLRAHRRSVLLSPTGAKEFAAKTLQPECMHPKRHFVLQSFGLSCLHSAPLGRDETVRRVVRRRFKVTSTYLATTPAASSRRMCVPRHNSTSGV